MENMIGQNFEDIHNMLEYTVCTPLYPMAVRSIAMSHYGHKLIVCDNSHYHMGDPAPLPFIHRENQHRSLMCN